MSYTKTIEKRNELKKILDSFSTFQLGGTQDMFDKYGIFIIDSGNSGLKFYNGPSFSNEYSSPQFSKNRGSLLGVNFNGLTISFTCGVYWFSIGEYRKLLEELNPLKTTYLVFDFNKDYRYNVKLAKCDNSTRYIIGYEDKEPRYYTELSLSFDIQGDACAIGTHPYEFGYTKVGDTSPTKEWKEINGVFTTQIITTTSEFRENDIYTPIEIPLSFKCIGNASDFNKNIYHKIKLEALKIEKEVIDEIEEEVVKDRITLFDVELQNLTLNTDSDNAINLKLRYVSENGLLFLQYANSNEKLLNLLNTTDTGEKIVKSSMVNKFLIPGSISNSGFTIKDVRFELTINKYDDKNSNLDVPKKFFEKNSAAAIICYPRTNII